MSYPPNIKAAHFLAETVIPLLTKKYPNIKLAIAGATPHHSVKRLASKNVIVTGWMDQITDAYNQSKIFIAPMEIGTGMQNKILEAMAMEVPCITSRLASEAIGGIHEKNILIGNSETEYVALITRLITDQELRETLTKNALAFVKENYSWNINGQALLKLVSS